MDPIKFFVLVPVYKTEAYIRNCIDSALGQTYGNFQLIIVDDGTPDQAGAIADAYAATDARIHVIHKENGGLISARRAAIHYVKTHCDETNGYYIFLDSDDSLLPHALEVVANTIRTQGGDLVIYGAQRVRPDGWKAPLEPEAFTGCITERRELYRRVFSRSSYNALWRKAIACHLVEDTDYSPYFHISHGEDLLQSLPVYETCQKAVFIADVLYNYAVNPTSITQSFSVDSYKINTTVRHKVWEAICREPSLTAEDMQYFEEKACRYLQTEVLRIGAARGTRERKLELYAQIRKDPYYSMLLDRGADLWVLKQLRQNRDRAVIRYARIRSGAIRVILTLRQKLR